MIVVMKPNATVENIEKVVKKLEEKGFSIHISEGVNQTVIGAIGDKTGLDTSEFEVLEGVEKVVLISEPYKLSNRAFHPNDTLIELKTKKGKKVVIGGEKIQMIAGPCSVEGEEQMMRIAKSLSEMGIDLLRGGAFKPRTSPYSFQGLGVEGLKYLRQAADEYDMLVVTELMDLRDLDAVYEHADIIQIGARNMYNYSLLKELGKVDKPILLKRGLSATIKEFLMSAEYILSHGNPNVILCERGIRTFETATRNTFDINAIPVLKEKSHLPVCADPSHGTGVRSYVKPIARAAVAAGADSVMVEVHYNPEIAKSDAAQTLYLDQFKELLDEVRIIASAVGRTL